MKQLFWKEWYELRVLPLASAVCVAMLIFVAKMFNTAFDNHQHFTVVDTFLPLLATWMLFGVLAGAGLIAQEIGTGGLQFLSALPTSRKRIWWIKVGMALGMVVLSVLSSALVWAIMDAFVFQDAFFHDAFWRQPDSAGIISTFLLVLLTFFAVALAVSPFQDRPISAAVASLLVAIAFHSLLLNTRAIATGPMSTHRYSVVAALSVLVFAAISYWTFTRGETLRSAKRIRVGALTGVISLAVAGLVFLTGYLLNVW